MQRPPEQLSVQPTDELHVTSHRPPEQSAAHAASPPQSPVHDPLEQPHAPPPTHGNGFSTVPSGRGSGSDGGPPHAAITSTTHAIRIMRRSYTLADRVARMTHTPRPHP